MKLYTQFARETRNRVALYVTLLLLSWVGIWYTYNYAIDFSAIPITFLYLLLYFGFFELFDSKILTRIDTINEINKGNTAVSQFYLAIAVVLLAVAVLVG